MLLVNPQGIPTIPGDLSLAMDSMAQVQGARTLEQLLDSFAPARSMFVKDASPATGGAFLTGELEKPDFNINEPLTSVTWPRDIPVKTGGGFVDYTSNFFVDYGTTGANEYGLMGVDTNSLPTIQGNTSKDVFPVFRYGYKIKIPLISSNRMQMIGRSIQEILQTGLRLNYDKTLDQNAYLGINGTGKKGLVNQATSASKSLTSVFRMDSPANGTGSSRNWTDKTPEQILKDVNDLLDNVWANSEYADDGMPNQILLAPDRFSYLNGQLISSAGSQSILKFLLDNNIAKARGIDLQIVPCRQCIGAGTSSSSRMVAYRNDDKRLCFDETVPLTRIITQPDADQVAYLSTYVASVGILKILYYTTVGYMDQI